MNTLCVVVELNVLKNLFRSLFRVAITGILHMLSFYNPIERFHDGLIIGLALRLMLCRNPKRIG